MENEGTVDLRRCWKIRLVRTDKGVSWELVDLLGRARRARAPRVERAVPGPCSHAEGKVVAPSFDGSAAGAVAPRANRRPTG